MTIPMAVGLGSMIGGAIYALISGNWSHAANTAGAMLLVLFLVDVFQRRKK